MKNDRLHAVAVALGVIVYIAVALGAIHLAQATVSTTTNIKRVDGDGVTTAFTFNFQSLAVSDIHVYTISTTNVLTEKTQGVDFSVVLNSASPGGTVTFVTAPSASVDVMILNRPALTQPANFTPGGVFSEADLETALDRAVLNDTAQQEELGRSLKLKLSDPLNVTSYGGLYIAAETGRAGKILQWNDAGTEVEAGTDGDALALSASTASAAAVSAASSAASAANSETAASTAAIAAAAAADRFNGTSSTSTLIGGGTKIFTTQSGKDFNARQIMVASAANPARFMFGSATYSGTTLTLAVTITGGSGTFNDWVISVSGARGATGPTGPAGPAGSGAGDMLAANNLNDVASASTSRTNLGLGTIATQDSDAVTITAGVITGITDLAIADGGTGASSAASARTNLGLGTAAVANTGTSAGNVVVLNGSAQLPAVDGSLLTGLSSPSVTAAATGKVVMGAVTIQWGTTTSMTQAGVAQTFGTAFSTTPYNVQLTPIWTGVVPTYGCHVENVTSSGFTGHCSGNQGGYYLAVGPT